MKMLFAVVIIFMPLKSFANCKFAYEAAKKCLEMPLKEDALSKSQDSLTVSVECNSKRHLCLRECGKNTKDAEDNNLYLLCKNLAGEQQDVINQIERRKQVTNPEAPPQDGLDFKTTEGSPGGIIQYKFRTNPPPSKPKAQEPNRDSSGAK